MPLRRVRNCFRCGSEQSWEQEHSWGRVSRSFWYPDAGRCRENSRVKIIKLNHGKEISIQVSQSKRGLVLFCIEDEALCLTAEEAKRFGTALIEAASESNKTKTE